MEQLNANPQVEKPFDIAVADPNEAFNDFYRQNVAFTQMIAAVNQGVDPAATAQEVMLKAWQQPDLKLNTGGRSWLRTVTRRQVVDEWRARQARPSTIETTPEMMEECFSTSAGLERVLHRHLIEQLRGGLSAEHFAILSARYLADMDVDQAAETLEIPGGTAKSRNYYALRAARKLLESLGANSDVVFGD